MGLSLVSHYPLAVHPSLCPGTQDGKMSQPPEENLASLEGVAMYLSRELPMQGGKCQDILQCNSILSI